jgi:hypothetical protein
MLGDIIEIERAKRSVRPVANDNARRSREAHAAASVPAASEHAVRAVEAGIGLLLDLAASWRSAKTTKPSGWMASFHSR